MHIVSPRFRDIRSLQEAILTGKTSCRAVVAYYLERIEAVRELNAYVEVWQTEALERAEALDEKIRNGAVTPGRLFGVVVSLKDNICYAGHQVTAASKMLEGFHSLYSATAVERLLAEDAIVIGRTNCDQFGMGSSNENSVYGPVRNAADPSRVSGGSSGGAAVALQTDTCTIALGTDTGGSIRQPAAFCGVMGFKPTYGRISRHGIIAYGSSFDQLGFMARNAADIALLLEICAGADDFDSTAPEIPVPAYTALLNANSRFRIAYMPEAHESPGMDAGVKAVTEKFMAQLKQEGHTLEPVPFDLLDFVVPAYYVLTTAEASTNLSRYDGVRYGYRSPDARNLEETYRMSRSEGFSEEVKRRILLGAFVLSSGYYDAYYGKAQQVRRLVRDRLLAIFEQYDLILLPVSPEVAWRFGEKSNDPVAMYLADIFTVLANLAGLPALSLPAGLHPGNDMPVGVQFMAAPWADVKVLNMGNENGRFL